MKGGEIDDLYHSPEVLPPADPGPLFRLPARQCGKSFAAGILPHQGEPDGPFARSAVEPSPDELWLARILWLRQGRENPISLREILNSRNRHIEAGAALAPIDERGVKSLVEGLRSMHRIPVGALRTKGGGYFIMSDIEDERAGTQGYRKQMITTLRTWRRVLSKQYRLELAGQLKIELEAE